MVFIFLLLSFFYHGSLDKEITVDRIVYEHFYNGENNEEHAYDELVLFNKFIHPGGREGYIVTNWLLLNESGGIKFEDTYKGSTAGYHKFVFKFNKSTFIVKTKIYQEIYSYGRDIERQNQDSYPQDRRVSVLK